MCTITPREHSSLHTLFARLSTSNLESEIFGMGLCDPIGTMLAALITKKKLYRCTVNLAEQRQTRENVWMKCISIWKHQLMSGISWALIPGIAACSRFTAGRWCSFSCLITPFNWKGGDFAQIFVDAGVETMWCDPKGVCHCIGWIVFKDYQCAMEVLNSVESKNWLWSLIYRSQVLNILTIRDLRQSGQRLGLGNLRYYLFQFIFCTFRKHFLLLETSVLSHQYILIHQNFIYYYFFIVKMPISYTLYKASIFIFIFVFYNTYMHW